MQCNIYLMTSHTHLLIQCWKNSRACSNNYPSQALLGPRELHAVFDDLSQVLLIAVKDSTACYDEQPLRALIKVL